jgi:hypothetical protein
MCSDIPKGAEIRDGRTEPWGILEITCMKVGEGQMRDQKGLSCEVRKLGENGIWKPRREVDVILPVSCC